MTATGANKPAPRSITDRLEVLRFEFKAGLAEVRTEVAEVRTQMAELRTELKGDIAGLRTELKGDIGSLASEFGEFRGRVTGIGVAAIALLPPATAAFSYLLARLLPGP